MSLKNLRTEILFGKDKTEKLKKSHVAVVGLGAVGSHAVEGIIRSGVEKITIVDFDAISESNFNRQLYAVDSNLGKYKTDAAEERILDINPNVKVIKHRALCHVDTFEEIFKDKPDIVIDAIDTLNPKVNLLMWLTQNNIKVVSSMGAARKLDPTKITVAKINNVTNCPLGKTVKKRLRRYNCNADFTAIFSTEYVGKEAIAEEPEENFLDIDSRQRRPMGSSPMITGIFGYFCALEAVKYLIDYRSNSNA